MKSTPHYQTVFKRMLRETGNVAGAGGVFGSAASIGAQGSASGTPGKDTYAPGDFRTPKSLLKGVATRKGVKRSKKRK